MRIRRIKINNFRNFKDFEVYPSLTTTTFVGENNSGKSNLLHALRLLFDPDGRRLISDLSEDDINETARSEGAEEFSILIEIGDLQKHQELEAIFRERIILDGEETYISIEGKYSKDEDGIYDFTTHLMPSKDRKNEPIQFSIRMTNSIPLFFLDAIRDAKRELRATGRGAFSQLINKIDFKDVEKEVIENIQEANKALSKNTEINDLADNITKLLSPHIPGGEGDVSIAVATEDPSQLVKGLRLNLKRKSDLKAYDLTRHGTGIQNLLLIALFRHRILSSGIIQPILAIEEPEAHLHPQAQRCLFDDLNEIDSPVILTTHSPSIVECSNPLGIIRLSSNENNHVEANLIDTKAFDLQNQKLLERMMRAGRADALFARAIIIVEGASEVHAIPAFANHIGFNLNQAGISVVPSDGNAFSFILCACNEDNFSIPAVVTFDTDSLKSDNNLIKEAFKAGLINKEIRDSGKNATVDVRKTILEKIGWIPVIPNFEEEVAKIGYLDLILKIIDEEDLTTSFKNFIETNNLEPDAHGVSEYLNSKKGSGLKVTVARSISDEVENIGKIPECFEKAIKVAMDLSNKGEKSNGINNKTEGNC